MTWTPKPSIDDKKKTGDQDQYGMIWAAHECIIGEGHNSTDFTENRKQFSRSQAASEPGEMPSDVADMLSDVIEEIGGNYKQLAVNLALFGFRTAGGGRARKIANWMRYGKETAILDSYLRPFEEGLPDGIVKLLPSISHGPLIDGSDQLAFHAFPKQHHYIPPTRFTATFPLALAGNEGKSKTITDPRFPSDRGEPKETIKFAFMGSFGFSEPSYTTWVHADGNEYAGTRLSLGAYSLNVEYLEHLLGLLKQVKESDHKTGYKQYGGARTKHVQALLELAKTRGHALAISWVEQMAVIAQQLVEMAKEKVERGHSGLASFFDFLLEQISRRADKLTMLESKSDLNHFEYIWVLEASLWEIAFIGATCLTLAEIQGVLSGSVAGWGPSVGRTETAIHEILENVPCGSTRCTFTRLYGPTGTAAANTLYDKLCELGFLADVAALGRNNLDTFTPYFEFYLGGFLHPENVEEKRNEARNVVGSQIWVNLSDSLHSKLMGDGGRRPGGVIVGLLKEYLNGILKPKETSAKNVFVIDFTKFGAEMPNGVVYPMLAEVAHELIGSGIAAHVVFLRSNLKYNTGTLDRYQSGEVLILGDGPPGLSAKLKSGLKKFFEEGHPDPMRRVQSANKWGLCGEYVSMMKKVYLLSDAIGWWRWERYVSS